MAILKIRDADGNVQEILAVKGDKGDPGEFAGGELLKAHINDKDNPHGATAKQIGAAPMSEVGNKEEVYNLCWLPEIEDDEGFGVYITATGDYVRKEGCYAPYAYLYNYRNNPVTVKVKTYMYGDMAITWYAGAKDGHFTNANANVAENPESGIFEQEFIIPPYTEGGCYISFCENPYLECPVFCEKKNTLWEEVRTLTNNTPFRSVRGIEYDEESGDLFGYFCRFSEGVLELDASVRVTGTLDDEGKIEYGFTIPVDVSNYISHTLVAGARYNMCNIVAEGLDNDIFITIDTPGSDFGEPFDDVISIRAVFFGEEY